MRIPNDIADLATFIAKGLGGSVAFEWQTGSPVTINASKAVELARKSAINASDIDNFEWMDNPLMVSEDFSFMLEHVPGAYMSIGNGNSSPLHTSEYDFNDAVLSFGVKYFSELARTIFDT